MASKVVFITGAASGIGLEAARQLSLAGDTVIISDIDRHKLEIAQLQLMQEGIKLKAIELDVTREQDIIRVLKNEEKEFGRIDLLINNAGLQHVAPIEEFPTPKFRLLIDVILTAAFVTTKQVFPGMKHRHFGRIINIASINGLIGFAGKAAYNSAKHGLIGLTKVTALEGAKHNITANALCPGYVDTPLVHGQLSELAAARRIPVENILENMIYPLVPAQRLLTVDEVANYILFLAGEKAGGITGQAVVIDGGYTAQ